MKTVKKLRNKNHKTIANVETFPDGRTVFRSEDHKIIGYYDPRTNRTLDVNHHTVGYGYLLPALLDRGLLDEEQDEDMEDLDEMIEPSKPTSPESRAKSNAKSLDLQRKINAERAKSADKIADLQAKRP